MDIEQPLEKLLPARELVELVEQDDGHGLGEPIQLDFADQGPGPGKNQFPVVDIVPVDVGIGAKPTGSGLAHLARSADKRHLAMVRQMFGQQGIVDAGRHHARRLSISSSNGQDYFTIGLRLVIVVPEPLVLFPGNASYFPMVEEKTLDRRFGDDDRLYKAKRTALDTWLALVKASANALRCGD